MQYSFFSCEVKENEFIQIREKLKAIIDRKYDKICFIPICDNCIKKIIYLGCDENFILPDYMVL